MSTAEERSGGAPGGEPFELTLEEALDPGPDAGGPEEDGEEDADGSVPATLLAAATAWADLVLILGVAAATAAALRLTGYAVAVTILPWTAALGLFAWLLATAALLLIRGSWPGALLLGLALPPGERRRSVAGCLALLLLALATAGALPALLARRRPWGSLVPEHSL